MNLPSHIYLDERNIPYERKRFPPEAEKGAANVARVLGFSERQAVKTLIFRGKRMLREEISRRLRETHEA